MISEHTKLAVIALVNVDRNATKADRDRVVDALSGAPRVDRIVRVKEAARMLGLSSEAVLKWARCGRLQAVRGPTGKIVGVAEASLAAR
jgi:hypothetical protein